MNKVVLLKELQDILQGLPLSIEDGAQDFCIRFGEGFDWLYWKEHNFVPENMNFLWKESPHFRVGGRELYIAAEQNGKDFQKTRQILARFRDLIYRENLQSQELWPENSKLIPSGFSESKLPTSAALLQEVYRDGLIVAEKKGLVLDLDFCQGPALVGIDSGRPSIFDAAAQIASLAIGNNSPLRRSMLLRPELRQATTGADDWDVKRAFSRLMTEESGLSNIRFLNSGAEAMEAAVLSCLKVYPKRKRVIAFNGSFHGRTYLALHATHSPAKRLPFEFFPDRIEFLDFPENKDPTQDPADPSGWLQLWSEIKDETFHTAYKKCLDSADPLLAMDLKALLAVRDSLKKEAPLCVVIEPIQCEGGDRFATSRFFRGLRLVTRAFDVSLIFDEVQSGMGLGGSFFWFQSFQLKKKDGTPDLPDAVYMAKKAQVGVALSRFELPGCDEFSPASLYRGYIQANEIYDWNASELEEKVRGLLRSFQEGLGEDLIRFPRNKALAFAFDLPNADFLNDIIKRRFEFGMLFYPAGTETARFRLTKDVRDDQILHMFLGLFADVTAVALAKGLKPKVSLAEWIESLPSSWRAALPKTAPMLTSKFEGFPLRSVEAMKKLKEGDWDKIYKKLVLEVPQLLHSAWNDRFYLDQRPKSLDELVELYRKDGHFTQLDLLWMASRFFGTKIRRMSAQEADSRITEVRALEELVYEPERVSPADFICGQAKDPQSIVLLSEGSFGEIRGICVCVPLHLCKDVPMVSTDPDAAPKSGVLYSYDLTIHPKHQGRGMGLRMKCEQYMEARRIGAKKIKSRNRYPEAFAMDNLNHKLGAVSVQKNTKDYGGKATALYQCLNLPPKDARVFSVKEVSQPYLLNKMTLSNFVSRSYVYNTQILAEHLPKDLRHLYYTSGRAEAVEKSMRLLRYFRPEGKVFLSIQGDSFSYTTACGSSLGGEEGRVRYFDWPLVKSPEDFEKALKDKIDPKTVFGLYVEVMKIDGKKKKFEDLKAYKAIAQKHGIPVVFNESNSWGYRYDKKSFLAACEECCPEIAVFFGGGQIGVVAAKKEYFLDKPLMMISTWDGDDYSLSLLKDKIFESSAI